MKSGATCPVLLLFGSPTKGYKQNKINNFVQVTILR